MTLAVAVAGCGYFSRFHHEAWSRIGRTTVVAVADHDLAKARAVAAAFPGAAAFADAADMIATTRPGLVDVVTPPATHAALIAAACAAGVPIICQKPLAPSYDDAVALVETAERAGVPLIVHENFRFMPWFREARRLVGAGLLGTPLSVSFRLRPGDGQGADAYLARQPYFRAMPRFLVHETAIHLIDVFRYLLGEVTGVFARLRRYNPAIAGEDAGLVVLDFSSGALGIFDGNRLLEHPAENPRLTLGVMMLEGTGGTLRLDGDGGLHLKQRGEPERPHPYEWADRGFGGDCVHAQCLHAVEHLLDGVPAMNLGRDYLRNLAIEEAIYRSNDESRFVAL